MKTPIISAGIILGAALHCVALELGDVTVVGYNADGTDAVAFTAWVDIPEGEEITITDHGYGGGGNGSGEGSGGGTYFSKNSLVVWENDTGAPIAAGTVIVVSTNSASIGSASGNLQLTTGGEHFFLLQGSFNGSNNLIGTLLFGIDYDNSSSSGWDGGSESELPGALNSSLGNLFFDGDASREFTGSRTDKAIAAYRAEVVNASNWGAPVGSLSSEAFVDSSLPSYLPGELMFLGWNGNDPDTLSFVSWVDIPNGETFLLFDAEYDGLGDGTGVGDSGGSYASLETMTWTNNEGVDLPAGTVVVISGMASGTSTANVGVSSGGFTITNQGEQLFIAYGEFSGTNFDGDLIFGVDFENGNAWDETDKSKLPSVLNVTNGNLAVGKQAAYEYSGTRNGSPIASYKDLVGNPSNWWVIASALSEVSFVETVIPPVAIPDQLGEVSGGLIFHPRRMNNGNALIDTAWLSAQGADAANSDNLNGPSCIRIPSWILPAQRAHPNAEYYLYFADHGGDYIRMAWATNLEGPWTGYRMHAGTYGQGQRGVLDLGADDEINAGGGVVVDGHIASPDVFVDDVNQRIVMYYHGNVGSSQRTVAATSADGLNFNMPSGGDSRAGQAGHGTIAEVFGESYFRVFEQDGHHFSLTNTGDLYGPSENETDPLTADYWTKGPKPFTTETESRGFLDWGGGFGALRPRHFGVLTRDNIVYAFFTNKAEIDERIKVSTFDLSNFLTEAEYEVANPGEGYNYWKSWKGDFPNQELLRAEELWEGSSIPLDISESGGETTPLHQLRDPDVFEDTDGRTYMFYSGKGEQAIGVTQLVSLPVVSGTTEVTTGEDHTYTVATDFDVTPSMLKISSAVPVTVEFGAEDGEVQELIHAGNSIPYEQGSTVNDGAKAYILAHDASGQSTTLTFPDRYYARPGAALEFKSMMGNSTTGQFAELQVSFDGTVWQTMWIKQGGTSESLFSKVSVDIDGLVGRAFEMRFRYVHETLRNGSYLSGTGSGRGWFFDEVAATGLEAVTDISDAPFTASSFTLDDITPLIEPFLTSGNDEDDRFLLSVEGLHSGTGFSESTGYGKPFVIRVQSSFEQFQEDYFTEAERMDPLISGITADPDKDGIINLLEHVFGTSPLVSDGSQVTIAGGGAVTINFPWNPDAAYTYQLQMGTELDDFEDIEFTETVTTVGDLLSIQLSPAPSVPDPGERAFFRVKVE